MKRGYLMGWSQWTRDDTTIVLWMLVVLGVACVVNMIAAQIVAAHLGIGAALGVFAGATLLGRRAKQ